MTRVSLRCGNFSSQVWDESQNGRCFVFSKKIGILNKSLTRRLAGLESKNYVVLMRPSFQ